MAKSESAGTLLYRKRNGELEVLIVHPSGENNSKAAWSIPKGKIDNGETSEEAARRETLEETGLVAPKKLVSLGHVVYKSKKRVYAYCGKVTGDADPVCASWEIDRAEFVSATIAESRLHYAQREFIQRLRQHVG